MSTYLIFNNAEAIQYADIVKGDIRMNMVIPTIPTAGDSRKWGLYSVGKGSGIYFEISGTTFQAVAIDGVQGVSTTEEIDWTHEWAGVEVLYRIIWEAGMAKFYINGIKRAEVAFQDDNLALCSCPLSLYVNNANADQMLQGYVECVGIQSYMSNSVN